MVEIYSIVPNCRKDRLILNDIFVQKIAKQRLLLQFSYSFVGEMPFKCH